MKKNTVDNWSPLARGLYKLLIYMKLTTVLIAIACLHVSAAVHSQSTVTLKISSVQLEKALGLIEKNSAYRFVYNDDYLPLNHKVTLDASDWSIDKVLAKVLENTSLQFRRMSDKLIVIAPAAVISKDLLVKGKVTSPAGEALPGVSVRLKNTAIGSVTDEKGNFQLSVPENAVLLFSYVGFDLQEVSLNGRESLTVVLEPSKNSMEEVIVVGYGTQKKINVTGAVDQISGKQLAARPIANVMQGLQGLSPGLNISYPGGRPGQTPTINIRGFTSINGGGTNSTAPLIIIDGIASATDDLIRLNPSDIATISVLRDAASAAIYGARASYGVILITTKQGTAGGKQTVSYSNYFASSRPTVVPEPITDPYIYSRVLETATDNTPWDYVNYSDEYYKWAKERSENPSLPDTRIDPSDPNKWAYMGSNDWNDYFFSKSNSSQYHSISLNGTAETAKKMPIGYLLSADYTKENGLNKLAKDDWNRYGLRGKINLRPISWLQIDNNLSVYQTKADAPAFNITDVYYLQPTQVAVNPDGTWANTAAGRLAAKLVDGGRNTSTRFGFQDIIRGVASFFNNELQITGDASFKRELWKYHTDQKKYNIGYGPNDIRLEGDNSGVTENNGTIDHDVIDLFANYRKSFGHHAINLIGGYSQESYEWQRIDANKKNLISSSLPYIALTNGDATVGTEYYAYAIRSFFGRINYTFNDRYILEVNGRYDGSSRFPSSNRWGLFPSVSGAWIASGEHFMKGLAPLLSTLKLRASYGSLGNQSVSYFGYIQSIPTKLSDYLIGGNARQTIISGAPLLTVDPSNYTWEKVTTTNVGGDLGFLENRLQASFDYFIRNTKGMLTQGQELPAVLGTSAPQQNAADLSTRGWELTLGYRNEFNVAGKPLSFGLKVTLSDDKTKITRFKNDQQLFSSKYWEGQTIGELWGLTNDGYFKSKDEANKLNQSAIIPWGALEIVEGWPKYKDLNNDQKIELGPSAKDPKDLSVIGNTSPRYRYGINLDMSWNNIDLSVFMQGIAKMDYYPHHYLFWGPFQQPYANIYPWNLDFYRGKADDPDVRAQHSASYIAAGLADANTNSYYPVLQSWLADNNNKKGLDIPQSKYLLNAAYLRIKNVTIGYTLPASLTKRYHISRLRIFVSGENVFEFSSIKKYVDPESIIDGFGWAYPYQRKFAAGLNLDL